MSQTVQVKWHGAKAKADTQRGAERGLYLWAEHVLEEAVRIVPLQEGTLMRSGVAHKPESGTLQAAVSFDGPYAARQHEEMDWQHPGGRQAKYLENPLNASKDTGMRIVQREIKQELKS